MNIVSCYNKNNEYCIDFRKILEEDEYLSYDESLKELKITFTDIAKEPSSVNEIISRTVHNFILNPDDLGYLILDKSVILDANFDNLMRLKNAIKEYADKFKNMILLEQGGDPVSTLKRESGNGKNFYHFTESDREKLIKDVFEKIIELERHSDNHATTPRVQFDKLVIEEKKEKEEKEENEENEEKEENGNRLINRKTIKGLMEKRKKQEKNENLTEEESIKEEPPKKEIKLPLASYIEIKPVTTEEHEVRINHQEDVSVKEMIRREKKNTEKKEEVNDFAKKGSRITEERLLKGVKMQHILKNTKNWKTKQNVILVRGLYGNICATYFSLLMANMFQKNNASVVYINDSHSDFLYTLENFSVEKVGNYYVKNNIVFMEDFISIPDVNFYIIDSKEAYYQNADILKENGFTPYYLVVVSGDAKGLNYLRNERNLLNFNNIEDYRFIVRDIKESLRTRFLEEVDEKKVIEYKHLEDEPFSSIAENSRISKEVYSVFSKFDDRVDSRIVMEQLEEENER